MSDIRNSVTDAIAMLKTGEPQYRVQDVVDLLERSLDSDRRDHTVLTTAVKVVTRALDNLVDSCTGDDGKPKAPDRGEVLNARKLLPNGYKHTLQKK
jgi:hypothetical protein